MPYNQQNYRRIRQEYESKYLNAREDAERRRREVELLIPEVLTIHRELSQVGLEIMHASLEHADDSAARESAIASLRQKNEVLLKRRAALLLAAGFPADYTELRYECPDCSDTGFLDDSSMCECMRRRLRLAGYESSGLGNLLREQTFDNYSLDYFKNDERAYRTMSAVLHMLRDWAQHFSPASDNLLLLGGTGLGKTHLSTAVAKTVLDAGHDVLYTTAVGMLSAFEAERFGNASGPSDESDINRYYNVDLLIIDDLGTEVSNQFTVSTLYNVINTRLNLHRPTIISTNLMQEELRRRYWDRITSRLFGEYRILLFLGTDVRAQKIRQGHK
jgi:DNA replication protein DnaC